MNNDQLYDHLRLKTREGFSLNSNELKFLKLYEEFKYGRDPITVFDYQRMEQLRVVINYHIQQFHTRDKVRNL